MPSGRDNFRRNRVAPLEPPLYHRLRLALERAALIVATSLVIVRIRLSTTQQRCSPIDRLYEQAYTHIVRR
jgi:hypothetical protein